MSWRTVVVAGTAKLDLKMGFLVVRKETTIRIHLSEIHTLMVDSTSAAMTTALLNELIRKKIKVIFCDEKHNPSAELVPYNGSHDCSLKIKLQTEWGIELKRQIWTEIVAEKIRKQMEVLAHYNRAAEAELLRTYLEELQLGDETNREGHAAKVYFNALFGMDFTRSQECVTNAALNYGYSILLSAFNREIAANGYLTQLGLFHENRFNPFNLASDLMEPFRPLVDRVVVNRRFEKFEHDEKMVLMSLMEQYVSIADSMQRLTNAIKIYCKSVFDAINQRDIGLLRFYDYEL